MTSLSFNEAFVIIRQDENGRPHEIIRHNTNAFTYVASPAGICRQSLKDPTVKTAFKKLAELLHEYSEARYKNMSKDDVVKIFIAILMEHFPILFADRSLTNPSYRATHWRRAGDGTNFDIRKQSIVINGVVLDNTCLAGEMAERIGDPDSKEQKRFRVFLFSIAAAFLHELGHVFGTFLSDGKLQTPPEIDAQVHLNSPNSSATKGEAGAYLEEMIFGGTVGFARDPAQDDRQPGIPYLIKKDATYEISQKTIDEFVNCHFTFPFSDLGPKKPADLRPIGHGLPWVVSKRNPMGEPETRELLAGRPINPYSMGAFDKDIDDLLADNPNPKIFSFEQESVIRKVPFDPSLRVESPGKGCA